VLAQDLLSEKNTWQHSTEASEFQSPDVPRRTPTGLSSKALGCGCIGFLKLHSNKGDGGLRGFHYIDSKSFTHGFSSRTFRIVKAIGIHNARKGVGEIAQPRPDLRACLFQVWLYE
jgi:hypothetical protein